MNDHNNNLSTFLTGVVVGAALAYLFGTKSGQKIKTELIKEGAKALEKLGDELESHEDEIKEKMENSKEHVKEKLAEGVKEVEEVVAEIPEHIEKIQKKGRRFFFSKKPSAES